ncbi:methyltransferase domain-containing protein [Nocardia sp. BSTN01]|uniref:methyltransferase domain-containing protein n=1 Tax=Nocardia sp. BSTN01 TaxID=2783665 RepID=UPI00188DCB9E|nr:methyltransferase domain-containing protein [Nocardia sp. BSTN01]MBF4999008.1 methyltransferase domain-containing protein [Nocardia sp. BSTN01]
MSELGQFRAVYEAAGVYDKLLLPHYFDGRDDVAMVADLLERTIGVPGQTLSVVEFGCGTGRMTSVLEPYAFRLVACDYSAAMIDAVVDNVAAVETVRADTRDAVAKLLREGQGGRFDIVAAFWSLSYPIGEFFEQMSAHAITPLEDVALARERAMHFVEDMLKLLAPQGHFLAVHFDAETPEQRLVTRLWERVCPFPEGGRSYTLSLLLDGLRVYEDHGYGVLSHTRCGGSAVAPNREAALRWFLVVHLKSYPALVRDPQVHAEIEEFIARYALPDGSVALPSGAHVVHFRRSGHPVCHIPRRQP